MKQICVNNGGLPESLGRRREPRTVADLSYSPHPLRSQVWRILSGGVRQNKLSLPQC